MKTPTIALLPCRSARLVRAICPTRLPETPRGYYALVIAHLRYTAVSLSNGGNEYPDVRRDAPPSFVHVVLECGDLSQAFETFTYPQGGKPTPTRDELLLGQAYASASNTHAPYALYLGRVRWSGRSGTLVLVPPFTIVDSIDAGHLIFRWRQAGRDCAISLHAWEPFARTVSTLEAVVASIPR